jgi:large subunit ribosomal protein L17
MYARKLNKATDHRMAMLKNMVTSLFEMGRIRTTFAKTKEVGVMAEKIITKAKKSGLHNKRQVFSVLKNETVAKKLFDEIAPRFYDRKGGYTRINKLGPRRGDSAEMALIELVS